MKTIKFEIATPERIVLKDEVAQVTIPTLSGEITVLPNHIPLVGVLLPGVLELVKEGGEKEIISVSGGFVEVLKEKIVILADTAERAEEIDESRLEEAHVRAEEMKSSVKKFDKVRFANINARIATELARGKAVKRWKKIKNIK